MPRVLHDSASSLLVGRVFRVTCDQIVMLLMFTFILQEANLYKAAQEIDYLDKVIQETLRLHPPAIE